MKYVSEFRDKKYVDPLIREISCLADIPLRIMEVCGTHTMAIFRHGLRSLLPKNIELISGPGCPVCVTSSSHVDAFVDIARQDGVQVAIFGDLFRVPGSKGTLAAAQSDGARVEVVYSPMDALQLAVKEPQTMTVFLSVGFETTIPLVAATILDARRQEVKNFAVFSSHKIMPPALDALLVDPELRLSGLLCPGHVSTIIGVKAYEPLAEKMKMPCVVAGFEPVDVLQAILLLVRQVKEKRAEAENGYGRAVTWEGNTRARQLMKEVFRDGDAHWRGLGVIEGSGMFIRDEFSSFDAEKRFDVQLQQTPEPKGCLCGAILKGRNSPPDCPLFGKRCIPLNPVGPCMVSNEGTCAAFYRYGI